MYAPTYIITFGMVSVVVLHFKPTQYKKLPSQNLLHVMLHVQGFDYRKITVCSNRVFCAYVIGVHMFM